MRAGHGASATDFYCSDQDFVDFLVLIFSVCPWDNFQRP